MKTKIIAYIQQHLSLFLFGILLLNLSLNAQAGRRINIWELSGDEKEELADLILTYLDDQGVDNILEEHAASNAHDTGTVFFLTWHRDFLRDLEQWLFAEGFSKYVPLPKWDPDGRIPWEFRRPSSIEGFQLSGLTEEPANCNCYDFSEFRNVGTLCGNFNNINAFSSQLESHHNQVHGSIGGVMASVMEAPRSAIFWLWHAWIDDVFYDYNCHCSEDIVLAAHYGNGAFSNNTTNYVASVNGFEIGSVYRRDNGTFLLQAEDILISQNRITASSAVTIRASDEIILEPGFETFSNPNVDIFTGCGSVDSYVPNRLAGESDETPRDAIQNLDNTIVDIVNTSAKNNILQETPYQATFQTYPNPFSSTSTIEFELPTATAVNIQIYNTNGQLIAALANGETYESGKHTLHFEAQDLPAGTYICQLKTESEVQTQKMLLVK